MRIVGSSSMTSTTSPSPAGSDAWHEVASSSTPRVLGMTRQVDAHRRALADLGIDPDLPARLAREAIDHRQAQPGALAERLGREERLERLGDDLRASCRCRYRSRRSRHTGRPADPAGAPRARRAIVGGLDRQLAAVGHGIARVDAEVENGVFELVGVDQRRPQAARADDLDLDAGPDGAPDELLEVARAAG